MTPELLTYLALWTIGTLFLAPQVYLLLRALLCLLDRRDR